MLYLFILWTHSHLTTGISQEGSVEWEACLGLLWMVTAGNRTLDPLITIYTSDNNCMLCNVCCLYLSDLHKMFRRIYGILNAIWRGDAKFCNDELSLSLKSVLHKMCTRRTNCNLYSFKCHAMIICYCVIINLLVFKKRGRILHHIDRVVFILIQSHKSGIIMRRGSLA